MKMTSLHSKYCTESCLRHFTNYVNCGIESRVMAQALLTIVLGLEINGRLHRGCIAPNIVKILQFSRKSYDG